MNEERRHAIKNLATLPVGLFFSSPAGMAQAFVPEEVLPWLAAGLIAAGTLGRGNDLALADMIAETYLPILESMTNNARYRQPAAILATH